MDRISNTLHRFGGVETIISSQIRAMITQSNHQIEPHVKAFAQNHQEFAFASIPMSGTENRLACSITIYRDKGNIKVKTTAEHYEPGSPHEVVQQHVQEMRNEAHTLEQQKRTLDAQHMQTCIARHQKLLTDGTYKFPYEQVNRIANKLADQGIGKVTINRVLDAIARYDPTISVMVGFYNTYREPLATIDQIDQITRAAEKAGLDPSVIGTIRDRLGAGMDHPYEIAKLSVEQATATAKEIRDAGFNDNTTELVIEILTTDGSENRTKNQ